jgi:uncharacterized membrane protein YhaH (DUF805 family)
MLEDLALQYSEVSEDDMRLISYGLVILGGIIGGLTYRSTTEIRRAHYFALSGQIFLSIAVVTFGGMAFIVQALAGGFFWVVVAAEMLASVAGGFFVARIAADRSRDAYGHGRAAALAFIPFANFWLLLTPSKNEMSVNRAPAIPLLTGGLGVLSGFVMLGAGISLSAYAQVDGKRRVEEAAAAGIFAEAMLDRTLVTMAAEVQTPLEVDETTTLLRIEAVGRQLRYVYEVDGDAEFLPADMRLGLTQQNCTYEGLTGVIDAGAIVRHVYLRTDGSEIGVVEVTRQVCGR